MFNWIFTPYRPLIISHDHDLEVVPQSAISLLASLHLHLYSSLEVTVRFERCYTLVLFQRPLTTPSSSICMYPRSTASPRAASKHHCFGTIKPYLVTDSIIQSKLQPRLIQRKVAFGCHSHHFQRFKMCSLSKRSMPAQELFLFQVLKFLEIVPDLPSTILARPQFCQWQRSFSTNIWSHRIFYSMRSPHPK